jgi:hypothetical protein
LTPASEPAVTRAIAVNPKAPARDARLAGLITRMSAARARALNDEALFMTMFSLYRLIRATTADDPMRQKLLGAWELMDAETIQRGRDRLPRLRLHS